jgi:enoyl-CoA hydratase
VTSTAITSDRRGGVVVITINRPERRNAVDAQACRAIHEAVSDATDSDARAIVLTGAGGHFCAGADLHGGVHDDAFHTALRGMLDALVTTPMPVIAAVQGAALGAGTQLAVACDLRVATPDARFGIPAAKLGLMVDHWTVQRLSLAAGHGPARAMLLAAEQLTGEDAHRLGLAQRLGDLDAALAWADEISRLAPLTIAGHKLAMNRVERELGDPDVLAAFAQAWQSRDLQEGMAAFKERRAPEFLGH